MSSYSSVEIEVELARTLTEENINLIKSLSTHNCGCHDRENISENKIDLVVTFNHNFNAVVKLIAALEKIIHFEKITDIGRLNTEDIPGLDRSRLVFAKGKILAVSVESQPLFCIQNDVYDISDMRGINAFYHNTIDHSEKDVVIPDDSEVFENFINQFLKEKFNID